MQLQFKTKNLVVAAVGLCAAGSVMVFQASQRAGLEAAQGYAPQAQALAQRVVGSREVGAVTQAAEGATLRATILGDTDGCTQVVVAVERDVPGPRYRAVYCVKADGQIGGSRWDVLP